MKKSIKIVLIIIGLLIVFIILDTFQALLFNNNPIIGVQTKCRSKSGLFVMTYHCENNNNITRLKKNNVCYYESVCKETISIDYAIAPNDINNLIIDYLTKKDADLSNIAYNYVDEEKNKVVVGLLDINSKLQDEFIYNVFTNCCGSDYIKYIKEHKLIEFIESKDIFEAKIIDVKDTSITVEVIKNSKSFKAGDKVTMKKIESYSSYTIGTKVRITFNGMVETSNPAQIGAVKIETIKDN